MDSTTPPKEGADGRGGLATCSCCGLLQRVPAAVPQRSRAHCPRCDTRLRLAADRSDGNRATLAFALAALAIYPVAITQPILRIEEFGHSSETSIVQGTISLLSDGQILVGAVVLICSILLPVAKLFGLISLSLGRFLRHEHRASTYHLVEWTGRWGMLDVLLVSILVAALKLGDLVEVSPGPAAAAFAVCVLLSLLASASFDPHVLWRGESAKEARA